MAKKTVNTETVTETVTETKTETVYVVATNTSRGVYFGELKDEPKRGEPLRLHNVRHCFTWNCFPEAKGVWGLALKGPAKGSQIGPTISSLVIHADFQYAPCTSEAVTAWKAAKWE